MWTEDVMDGKIESKVTAGLSVIGAVIAIIVIGWWGAASFGLVVAWLLIIAVIFGVAFMLGWVIRGRPAGLLIDQRNKMSLSRLQSVAWTVLVLGTFWTAAEWQVRREWRESDSTTGTTTDERGPLDIPIPQELWVAIGISATALVGSSLIKTAKAQASPAGVPDPSVPAPAGATMVQVRGKPVSVVGRLQVKASPDEASWTDMFKGDEAADFDYLDIGKVQMFFFTVVLVLAYGVAIAEVFHALNGSPFEFPDLSEGAVTLLAISQGTYLADKAIPSS
jgi:hypothetical protein